MITVDHDNHARVYFSKVGSRDDVKQIASAVIQAGINLAEQHGFKLDFTAKVASAEVKK